MEELMDWCVNETMDGSTDNWMDGLLCEWSHGWTVTLQIFQQCTSRINADR